jgi:hypothetical protein
MFSHARSFSRGKFSGGAWGFASLTTPPLANNRVERKEVGPDPRLNRSGRGFPQTHGSGPTPSTLIPPGARRKPRIRPRLQLPPPAHLAQAVVGRLPVAAAMLWPGVDLALCSVDMAEVPPRARLDRLAAASASDQTGLDHRGDRSPSSAVSLSIAALFRGSTPLPSPYSSIPLHKLFLWHHRQVRPPRESHEAMIFRPRQNPCMQAIFLRRIGLTPPPIIFLSNRSLPGTCLSPSRLR